MATREANNAEWSRRKRSRKTYAEWEDVKEARRNRIASRYGFTSRPSRKWESGPLGNSGGEVKRPDWF